MSDPGDGAPGPPPQRVGVNLDRVLRGLGAPDVDTIQVVFDRWSDVVGPTLAERTRPISIDGDALVIGTDEPAVASHVGYLEAELVERVDELLGGGRITRVQVRVRPR